MPDMEQIELDGVVYDVRDPTKAPAGFGLGTYSAYFDFSTVDSIKLNGKYCFATSGITLAGHSFFYGLMDVIGYDANAVTQVIYPIGHPGIEIRRDCAGGTWGEWELVNPPMELGVEYRTTERWDGKAVYTTLTNCGIAVAGTTRIGLPYAGTPIGVKGFASGTVTPYYPLGISNSAYFFDVSVDLSGIYINVGTDEGGKQAYVQIWYIKD